MLAPIILYLIYSGSWAFIIMISIAFLIAVSEWYKLYKALPYQFFHFILGLVYLALCFFSFGYSRFIDVQNY